MLVLTRKLQETIKIGENITITLLRVQGRKVRIGIEAPRDVRVSRGEIEVDLSGEEIESLAEASTDRPATRAAAPATPALAAAVRMVLAEEPCDAEDHEPATLHKILHRRIRRDQVAAPPAADPKPADSKPANRLTLRDFLPLR